MAVHLSRDLLDQIIGHAAQTPEREVCGLLTGTAERIEFAIAADNVAAEPARRFEIDPAVHFAAIRRARAGGPQVMGHYHSHPNGLAEPSACDAAAAAGPPALWLLVAEKRVTAWRSGVAEGLHGCFAPVALVIENG